MMAHTSICVPHQKYVLYVSYTLCVYMVSVCVFGAPPQIGARTEKRLSSLSTDEFFSRQNVSWRNLLPYIVLFKFTMDKNCREPPQSAFPPLLASTVHCFTQIFTCLFCISGMWLPSPQEVGMPLWSQRGELRQCKPPP